MAHNDPCHDMKKDNGMARRQSYGHEVARLDMKRAEQVVN